MHLKTFSNTNPYFWGKIEYEYFEGEWDRMPAFDTLKPLKAGEAENFDLSIRRRDDHFAIDFYGRLLVPVNGKYLLLIKSRDQYQVIIDDNLVMEHQQPTSKRVPQRDKLIELTAGEHTFTLIYLHYTGPHVLEVSWEGPELYRVDRKHWLYIGWENDYPKSWTYMGGTVVPGRGQTIQFTVEVDGQRYFPDEFAPERRQKIHWSLAEGYLPSPVSKWNANNIAVTIQHFAHRILKDQTTVVFSRISLTNTGSSEENVKLNLNAGAERAILLTTLTERLSRVTHHASPINDFFSTYQANILAGETAKFDFISLASGNVSPAELKTCGSFDRNYQAMKNYYEQRINQLAHPVTLPNQEMVTLYKALQIMMWESVVKVENGDVEMRGSGGNPAGYFQYDRTFSHDVPNMVTQFIREGDFELAKAIMESKYYQRLGRDLEQNYLDAIPKYLIPYALYLQFSGDRDYFTTEILQKIKMAAHLIDNHRNMVEDGGHFGIMNPSNTLDNGSNFLVVDNFAALHGLAAYRFISNYFGNWPEAAWATEKMNDLNKCFNTVLQHSMMRRKLDWYMAAFDDDAYFWKRGYDGNWLGTTLMMSTFPWNASLREFNLGGAWKDAFDRSIEQAIHLRDTSPYNIPPKSWGAWWGYEYGTCYNAGMGLQLLFSDKYRTLILDNIEFLLENQNAPFQWGESFGKGLTDTDWSFPATDYETWGMGFTRQAILEMCVAVKTNGDVIIGRGIPIRWSKPGNIIEWAEVPINNGKRLDFKLEFADKRVLLSLSGDDPEGNFLINLPVFVNNIALVSIDGKTSLQFDSTLGIVTAPGQSNAVVVQLNA